MVKHGVCRQEGVHSPTWGLVWSQGATVGARGWTDFGPYPSFAPSELGDLGKVTSLSAVSCPSEGTLSPTWQGYQ